jgi:hypothetical protein
MKKLSTAIVLTILTSLTYGQAAFVLPSPTNANDTLTLYIDLGQTTGGLKGILTNHPDFADSIYLWTWAPSGPVCGNGEWNNSNECMKMTHVSGLIYSKKFIPTEFYGCTPLDLFSKGINCLAKMKSGYEWSSDGLGEAKSEDLHVDILPALCSDKFCYFPEAARSDDFFSITYDNNQETTVELMNIGDDECYIYLRGKTGPFTFAEVADPTSASSTPALKMKPVSGQSGKFRITFVPNEFLPLNGATLQEVWYYIVKPGYTPTIPVFQKYVPLDCQ